MAYVLCSVGEGLRPSEVTAEVRDIDDRSEFLRVQKEFVQKIAGKFYLPIGIIHHDREKNLYLIELPHEADSGTNRLWVSGSSICNPQTTGSAVLT